MKILIYLNRTSIWDFHNVRSYKKLKKIFQTNSSIFPFKGNISSALNSADVCFISEAESKDSCYENISGPASQQATDSSSAMCLDEHNKPVMSKCKGSFTNKAEWSFNCTMCKEFFERDSDLQFQCSDGFSKFKQRNLCFKIYNQEKNWYDAYDACSEISSYMMNDLYEDFGSGGNFWLSYKYNYGKIQGFGMKPIHEELENVIIENPELHCVSAVFEKNSYKLQLENCSKKMQFVCIQNPYELISSVQLDYNAWTKFHHRDSCYYFDKSPKYNWDESISTCKRTFHGSSMLHGIQDIDAYKFLKWLIYQKYDENTCYSFSWWMNLTTVVENQLVTNANYVDWSPDVNLKEIKNRRSSITLFPGKKIYWTFTEADSKLRLLCERQKCEENRPTHAYIEDRSKKETITSSKNSYNYLKNFKLKCIPSGWFVTNSICWYKDGILLDIFDEYFDFSSFISDVSQITPKEALEYQGYYSCSVDQFSPIKTLYSSGYLFKIPGYHTVILSMVSQNKTYLSECGKYMVNEKLFKNSFENCFTSNLADTVKSFHFLLKNMTCNSTHLNITMHVHFEEEMGEEEVILKEIQNLDFYKFCEVCDIEHAVSSKSTSNCYKETMMLNDGNITWPTTVIGMTAYPEEIRLTEKGALLQRKCLGDFNSGAVWSEVSVDPVKTVTNIHSNITRSLYLLRNEIKEYGYGSLQILPNLTSSPKELQAADVSLLAQIFETLANQESLATKNLNVVVQTISNLIDAPPEAFSETADSSNQVIEYFEKITSIVDIEDREINVTSRNLHVNIYSFSIETYEIPNGIILMDGSTTALFNASIENLQSNCNLDVGIILPASLITENSNSSDRLVYTVTKDFPHVTDTKVLSFIVSATVPNVSSYEFPKDKVVLFFKLIEKVEKHQPPKCVFWDNSISNWSYKGCFSQEENENFVVCVCNHLSRFAVIMGMDSTISGSHQTALYFITNIGCSLSCIGFGLIIATFGLFRSWRKYLKNKTLFNYSISQFIFLIIFMTCMNQTNSETFCKIIAILLHYFLIASFAWMIALAYTVYLSLVKVLGTYIPCLIQKFMVFAWGIPAVIVIIILSVNPAYYSRDDYCWLSQDAITYGILIPLGTMLAINYIVFGTIVYLNTCKASSLRLNQERRKLVVTRTKALFCTSILLGLPWIFGFIGHFKKNELEFQYLFSITTPIQGFLLAISFVIRTKSTRELWLKLISPSSHSSSPSQTDSSYTTNKKLKPRLSKYENVINSVVYRAHSPFKPYL